ncbi:maleylpyruvate isomerase family mycothiol-dependent enzyme [Catellatospora methionotrophica]|uniref:maleylpyruvate isomerase family mycothiol-dependent enzyme n=1 Tax=Catellatospora methionotrophica TaxID=121620 RepID=UPI0033C6A391
MARLTYDRYCDEVSAQTALLREVLPGDDLSAKVPTCPDWTLADLVRHVGGNVHMTDAAVRGEPGPRPAIGDPTRAGVPDTDDPDTLTTWMQGGADAYARTLRDRDAADVAEIFGLLQTLTFWARRAACDILVHRADAALTTGTGYTLAPDLAADAVDELLELATDPLLGTRVFKNLPELFGPPRTIHLHATDTVEGLDAEWLIALGGQGVTWRHGHAKADVALQAPLTELLLILYRRLPLDFAQVHVHGDRELLDGWLTRVSMG